MSERGYCTNLGCPVFAQPHEHRRGDYQEPQSAAALLVTGPVVPPNKDLAERAKSLDAPTVVRNWLRRHVRPPHSGVDYDGWLDWAAQNFLVDPEVGQHLRVVPPADVHYSADGESLAVQARELVVRNRELEAEAERLRDFAEGVLSISDDPPQRRTITLEQLVQRAAIALDPDLDGPAS